MLANPELESKKETLKALAKSGCKKCRGKGYLEFSLPERIVRCNCTVRKIV